MHMKRLFFLIALLAVCSCDNDYLPSESAEELVVEGWIESGHAPIVLVSSTLPVGSTPRPIGDIKEHILRYAKVYIECDGKREYLTACLSDKFTIKNYFTSSSLRGETGKTYRLHVEWLDYKADAECTVPESVPVDTAFFVKEYNDTSFVLKMQFRNVPSDKKFYHTFLRYGAADSSLFRSVNFTTLRGELQPEVITESFMKPVRNETSSPDMYFHRGDRVAVKLATLEEPMYDFWSQYTNIYNSTGTMIPTTPDNLAGNVTGAIGYWAGYGISLVELTCR